MRRPYPNYRNSSVGWLGQVPEHWVVCPLKRVLAQNDGGVWGDDPDGGEGTVVLRSTEQTIDGGWSITDPANRELSPHERKGALLVVGDLVVTKSSGSALHIGKTSLVTDQVAQLEPCFSNFMQRLRCLPDFEPRLAWYLINSHMGRQQLVFNSNTTTGLANLNGTILGELLFPMPPPSEQRSIAAFLDRETAKIDTLIAKKRLLLDRLAEYRTALITRTVTKGLPPAAAKQAGLNLSPSLKPSGVEWIGEVPEHWEIKRLSRSVNRSDTKVEPDDAGTVTYVGLEHVTSWTGKLLTLDEQQEPESLCNFFATGTVLFAKLRPYLAKAFDPDFEGLCSTEFLTLEPKDYKRRYLLYLLLTDGFVSLVNSSTYGAKMPRANWEFIGNSQLPIPPLDEQHVIVEFLDRQMDRIDGLSSRVETAIERLQEYRTALITAAVTGKIDVRDHDAVEMGANRT